MAGVEPVAATVAAPPVRLARTITLPLAVLFGLGVTIGAGVYVLIGAVAGRAGLNAPLAFVLAALVMAPTAATFAELAGRLPVSAGEAAYVGAGFRVPALAVLVGLLVVAIGIVSAAAITTGSAGYVRQVVDLPLMAIIPCVVLAMGAVAAWGILESVTLAALMTLIEIGGLMAIVVVGGYNAPGLLLRLPEMWTGIGSPVVAAGVLSASLLAFFAFIGFESLTNIAEEVERPERTLPRAIFLTLAISTLLYIAVVWVALLSVPRADLARSAAPLSLVFERVTGASPLAISIVAIIATFNGIIAQMVMASRVIYGLADRGQLPSPFARVNRVTRTPLVATLFVVILTGVFATTIPLEGLAELTARLTLCVFALVNAALVLIKWRGEPAPAAGFVAAAWVPWLGLSLCLLLLVGGFLV